MSYVIPSWKQNAPGLTSRNVRASLRDSLLGSQDSLYLTQSNGMCLRVSIGYSLHIHAKDSLGKNLSQYLPIGALSVINLVIHAHIKFERPKFFSQVPPLEYVGWISWLLSLFKSRKFLSLYSNTWNIICYLQTMSSHSSFQLNSHEDLQGRVSSIWSHFDFLLTKIWGDHLMLLGQSQNSIGLFEFFLKNTLSSFEIAIECSCWGWMFKPNIFLAAGLASVTTTMHNISCSWEAWLLSHLIAKSSASDKITFIAW